MIWVGVAMILISPVLFWWDWTSGGALILPTFLGLTLILWALRILYWNTAVLELSRRPPDRHA